MLASTLYRAGRSDSIQPAEAHNPSHNPFMLQLQEPELSLKRIAASALSDIAKHTPELAQV